MGENKEAPREREREKVYKQKKDDIIDDIYLRIHAIEKRLEDHASEHERHLLNELRSAEHLKSNVFALAAAIMRSDNEQLKNCLNCIYSYNIKNNGND